MKKSLFPCSLVVCLLLTVASYRAMAQEDEPAIIHITVKEGGKVTIDTTFVLKEGQDPEMIEKLVSHLTGGDVKTRQKEVIIVQKGDDDCNVKELGWDKDHEVHLKHEGEGDHEIMIIISDVDGEKIQVKRVKKGNGQVTIIADDELLEWTEDDDDLNVYVIKKGDKEVKVVKKVTVQVEDESGKEMEKEVEVVVKKEKRKKEQ